MNIFLNSLSPDLVYIKHEIRNDEIHIYCENKNDNKKVHDRYERIVRDVPYGSYKTVLHLISKRYKIDGTSKVTKTEKFDFINTTGRRTKRLDEKINAVCKENSANTTARIINEQYGFVSHDTINRMIKKNQ